MSNRRKIQKQFEFWLGIVAISSSQILAYIFSSFINKLENHSYQVWLSYIAIITVSYCATFFCFYSPLNLLKRSRKMEFSSTLRNCTFTYALFAVLMLLSKNPIIQSRYMFISSFVLFFASSLFGRYILKKVLLKRIRGSKLATMTGIITDYQRAEHFVTELSTDWSKNIKAIALVDAIYENGSYRCKKDQNSDDFSQDNYEIVNDILGVPVVANKENIMGWIRTASLDEVFINLSEIPQDETSCFIEELEDMGVTVHVNIPSLEKIVENSKFENIECTVKAGYPMAILSPATHNSNALIIKRVMDIIGGLAGSIISLPIILLTAIPLKIESPGPLIFKQQRVGRNGRVFNIYKIRSMYVDAEERKKALMEQNKMDGHMFKMDNDPRITKVGKFIRKYSIDELPQFWNVLKGDMSLVGTRPPTIDEFEKYESHHKRRLSLQPGITGMWQVSGRSDIQDFEEVVKLDCEYIDNWSIGLDIKILTKTVSVVLTHKGAE